MLRRGRGDRSLHRVLRRGREDLTLFLWRCGRRVAFVFFARYGRRVAFFACCGRRVAFFARHGGRVVFVFFTRREKRPAFFACRGGRVAFAFFACRGGDLFDRGARDVQMNQANGLGFFVDVIGEAEESLLPGRDSEAYPPGISRIHLYFDLIGRGTVPVNRGKSWLALQIKEKFRGCSRPKHEACGRFGFPDPAHLQLHQGGNRPQKIGSVVFWRWGWVRARVEREVRAKRRLSCSWVILCRFISCCRLAS